MVADFDRLSSGNRWRCQAPLGHPTPSEGTAPRELSLHFLSLSDDHRRLLPRRDRLACQPSVRCRAKLFQGAKIALEMAEEREIVDRAAAGRNSHLDVFGVEVETGDALQVGGGHC